MEKLIPPFPQDFSYFCQEYAKLVEKKTNTTYDDFSNFLTLFIDEPGTQIWVARIKSGEMGAFIGASVDPESDLDGKILAWYITPVGWEEPERLKIEKDLLDLALSYLTPRVKLIRISLPWISLSCQNLLKSFHFSSYCRVSMRLDIGNTETPAKEPLHRGYRCIPWLKLTNQDSIDLIHALNQCSVDNDLFSSLDEKEGVKTFLEKLTRHTLGQFDPTLSLALVDENHQKNRPIGACLTIWLDPEREKHLKEPALFIVEYGLIPEARKKGLSRILLQELIRLAQIHSPPTNVIELLVTVENAAAFHLYQSLGFRILKKFPVWAKRISK
ncbi:MAG: GNAT family N-acetyltransferase [Promethearchaeota archaeon]|nr:MAG: GNAT family N-acetyltransferase [Candidatus Lokiarchaeota archaeon]